MKKGKLTVRQKLFILEYLKDLNGTKAAIRAGYSRRTAAPAASRLLRNVKVSAAFQEVIDRRAQRLELDAESVLQEIANIAFATIRNYIKIQANGSVYFDFSTLNEATAAGIAKVTTRRYVENSDQGRPRRVEVTRFQIGPKLRALELLGKHLGLFTNRHEHEVGPDSNVYAEFSRALGLDKLS